MARFFPVRSQCQLDTVGEQRYALEVASVNGAFATELLAGRDAGEDGTPIIVPESAGPAVPFPSSSTGNVIGRIGTDSSPASATNLASEARSELYGSEDSVKIASMDFGKGLEFGLVLIPGLGEI